MSRNSLPQVETKETLELIKLKVAKSLLGTIEQFGEFYEAETKVKPEQNALLVGILHDYFKKNAKFQSFLKGKSGKPSSKQPKVTE